MSREELIDNLGVDVGEVGAFTEICAEVEKLRRGDAVAVEFPVSTSDGALSIYSAADAPEQTALDGLGCRAGDSR